MASMVQELEIDFASLAELGHLDAAYMDLLSRDGEASHKIRDYLGKLFAEYLKSGDKTRYVVTLQLLASLIGRYIPERQLPRWQVTPPWHSQFPFHEMLPIEFPTRLVGLTNPWPDPQRLVHLDVGQIKELAEGVFVKKTEKGTLELYIAQT